MSDADLFEAFVLRHQDLVFATAVRLLGNRRDAEDIAQTVFLKAFQRFDELAASPAAAGWLKTVTTNLCLNHLSRYRSRWRFFSELGRRDEEGRNVEYETTLASEQSLEVDFARADEHKRLTQALYQLPPHQRVPLVLFHFDQMSYQEIATRLGVSLAKVKTDIHRGREVLAGLFGLIDMDPLDLERLVDRELKRLPALKAPPTLLPRVMRAVRAARTPAPAGGWRTLSPGWRVASLAAMVLVITGLVYVWPLVSTTVGTVFAGKAGASMSQAAEIAQDLGSIASAGRVMWRVVHPVAVFAFGLVAVMFAASAVFGTALGRVAVGGVSRV